MTRNIGLTTKIIINFKWDLFCTLNTLLYIDTGFGIISLFYKGIYIYYKKQQLIWK